jgi:hypothetical protein
MKDITAIPTTAGASKDYPGNKPDTEAAMNTIPDFTDAEQKLVSATLFERYGKLVPFQLADSELQLDASSEELALCPTIYWEERGAHFVVSKVRPSDAASSSIRRRSNTVPAMMNTTVWETVS